MQRSSARRQACEVEDLAGRTAAWRPAREHGAELRSHDVQGRPPFPAAAMTTRDTVRRVRRKRAAVAVMIGLGLQTNSNDDRGNAMKMQTVSIAMVMLASLVPAFAQTVAPLPDRVTPKKTWTDHTWTSPDGTKFHYVEQGKGMPVILIHGLTSSAVGNWFNPGIAQKLAKTNRVIALDMRGHGDTGPSPAESTGTMIQDIVDFMDFLKIEKAHIGGYSMGGATTAGLLKIAPQRFITASVMGIGIKETPEWLGKGADRCSGSQLPQVRRLRSVDLTPRADGAPRGRPRARRMQIRKSI